MPRTNLPLSLRYGAYVEPGASEGRLCVHAGGAHLLLRQLRRLLPGAGRPICLGSISPLGVCLESAASWAPSQTRHPDGRQRILAAVRIGDTISGRFQLEATVGQGGMGCVYRGRDLIDGSTVAVKLLDAQGAEDTRRFLREAQVLASINHPAIVRYRAHGATGDGGLFLAMQWVAGQDLAQRLKQGPLSVGATVDLALTLAEALAEVHELGIVHRDVKPANIIVNGEDRQRTKLVDFGVAHLSATRYQATAFTKTGVIVGTPGYLAPEQVSGGKVDRRTDVFALGCVLFECLTGRPAFFADSLVALLGRILLEPTPAVDTLCPQVNQPLSALISQMLQKEAAARPQDMPALVSVLRGLRREGATETHAPRSVAVSAREYRFVTVVAARAAALQPDTTVAVVRSVRAPRHDSRAASSDAAGAVVDHARAGGAAGLRRELQTLAERFGLKLAMLPGGVLVASVLGQTPFEQALHAARFALATQQLLDRASVTVTTGRGELGAGAPVGEAIDRAIARLNRTPLASTACDESTARLLRGRFVVEADEGGGGRLLVEREPDLELRRVLGRLTPFVGRRRELSLLQETFAECGEQGGAAAVLVIAEPGMGKSRLCREFVATSSEGGSDPVLLMLRGDPMDRGPAYGVLAHALRRWFAIPAECDQQCRQQRIRDRVAECVSSPEEVRYIAARLGHIVGVSFPEADDPALLAARRDLRLFSEQLQRAFIDWLAAACRRRPRLVVIDDAHWVDAPTLRLFDEALAALDEMPLMILGLARPQLQQRFAGLWQQRQLTEIKLGKLSKKAATELAAAVLGGRRAAAAVGRIVGRADGNPFFLEELMRAGTTGAVGTLPDTVLGTVEARIAGLHREARLVLRAASVFGETFWPQGVQQLIGAHSLSTSVAGWSGALAEEELVVEQAVSRFSGHSQFSFRHGLLREACYAMMSADDRQAGHLQAARWLEDQGDDNALGLAQHYELGAKPSQALPWWIAATRQALLGGDLDGTVAYAERGVACGAAGPQLGELRLRQAEALVWKGESRQALDHALQAVKCLSEGSTLWFSAAANLCDAAAVLGCWSVAKPWVTAVERAVEQSKALDRAAAVASLSRISFSLVLVGETRSAGALLRLGETFSAGQATVDPLVRGHLAHARAAQAMMAGRREDAAELYGQAAAAFDEARAKQLAGGAYTNVGAMLLELGDYERANEVLVQALQAAERARSDYLVALAQLNLGIAEVHTNALRSGLARQRRAAAAFRKQGDCRLESSARCASAETLLALGKHAEAELQARKALAAAAQLPPARASALAVVARVLLQAGQASQALALAAEGMQILDEHGTEEREISLRLVYAEAQAATGDIAGAQATIDAAAARLSEQAVGIRSMQRRKAFVQRISAHARVLALHRTPGSPPAKW